MLIRQVKDVCMIEQFSNSKGHSRSQQRTDQRVLVHSYIERSEGLSTYIEIFSPKKTGFSPVKNTFQNLFDFFTFFLCNFLVWTLQYFH